MTKIALPLLWILLFAVAALSQGTVPALKDDPSDILRIETQLVEVPVLVTDSTGKPVLNLKPANFTVYEDEKPQEIAGFRSTGAPFEVVLLLDTSGSTRADLRLIKRSAEYFLDLLRPGDRVSIVAFNSMVRGRQAVAYSEILNDLTDDRSELARALERVSTSNGTPYYDALLRSVEDAFRHPAEGEFRGRRALVALTDGVDSTSDAEFADVKEVLERSGVVTYFIRIDTRQAFEENLLGDCATATQFSKAQMRRYYALFPKNSRMERSYDFCKIGDFSRLDMSRRLYELAEMEMNELSKLSGGRVFPAADVRDAAVAFGKVAEKIGTKYSIGYYSSNEAKDGKYRSIRVELKGLPKGAEVRARSGYTAPSEEAKLESNR